MPNAGTYAHGTATMEHAARTIVPVTASSSPTLSPSRGLTGRPGWTRARERSKHRTDGIDGIPAGRVIPDPKLRNRRKAPPWAFGVPE